MRSGIQKQVLAQYRSLMRLTLQQPASAKAELQNKIRGEFRLNAGLKPFDRKVETLLAKAHRAEVLLATPGFNGLARQMQISV